MPYQLMQFPDYHGLNETVSYPKHSDMLNYLRSYADHFDLNKNINFNHLVIRVLPIENGKWEIIVKDAPNNKYITNIFDAIFVCSGHFSAQYIPQFNGIDQFKGKVIQSRNYRRAEAFQGMFYALKNQQ